jgi:peptide/nickel transport system substrate-binding protein
MLDVQERWSQGVAVRRLAHVIRAFLLVSASACGPSVEVRAELTRPTVRIGAAQIQLEEFVQNLTVESLARIGEDGHLVPRLAKTWSSPDNLSLIVELRQGVKFHDDSPVSASLVAETLRSKLPRTMGPAADDVLSVEAISEDKIEIKLRRPSRFVLEALEATIPKPGAPTIGTGAFVATDVLGEMRANDDYYLGPPTPERIVATMYPSGRAAWADFLRGRLDMIYEVEPDARHSLQSSTAINLFPYTRHYQFVVLLNFRAGAVRSSAIRRALNAAIDRPAFVEDALDNHGLPSSGPIWPRHWAAQANLPAFSFDPGAAASTIASVRPVTSFTCLVAPANERVALVVKRQLQAIGVEMIIEERSVEGMLEAIKAGEFDALLAAAISGPSLLRPYDWWHSKGTRNSGKYANASVDAALDAIRHARSDDEYRKGVEAFQRGILDDPPAIFLAWDERARAVSKRFDVPAEPDVDMMGTLRLWRLANKDAPSN